MVSGISKLLIGQIRSELNLLDRELVDIEGKKLKPSQCYRFGVNPTHILFNTNCPDSVKVKVKAILNKYLDKYESND